MKKLMVVVIILLAVSMVSAAIATEKTVYAYGESLATNARAFYSDPAGGKCNKKVWMFDITVEAQVAQWIEWSIGGTKWTWFVRKPGNYFGNCIEFVVKSNSDVGFGFAGFANLSYVGPGTSVNPEILVWYNFGSDEDAINPTDPDANPWLKPEELNLQSPVIEDSRILHDGWLTKLWNMIEVVECNSASTYRDTGTITITLLNQKPWIVAETGEWVEPLSQFVEQPMVP